MDKRINRFKICDFRFFPYLTIVFERLPETVRDEVLNDEHFQILADEDMFDAGALRYDFGKPVNVLVYLSSKIISEPKHQIIYTIAHQIADVPTVGYDPRARRRAARASQDPAEHPSELERGGSLAGDRKVYDKAISETDGFKAGYEWAKKQSKDYLKQHFGLYFDEWDERGLGKKPSNVLDKLDLRAGADSIFDHVVPLKNEKQIESEKDSISETASLRKAKLAGSLLAVKESEERDASIH